MHLPSVVSTLLHYRGYATNALLALTIHSGLRLLAAVSLLLHVGTGTIDSWWMTFSPAIIGDLLWSSFILRCLWKKVARFGWTRSCLPDVCKVITNLSKVSCFCMWLVYLETKSSFSIALSFAPLWLACALNICLPMLCRPMVLDRNTGALRQQTPMETLNRALGQQILPITTSILITRKLNGENMEWSFCCSGCVCLLLPLIIALGGRIHVCMCMHTHT